MVSFRSTCLISTLVTLMPQASVWLSRIFCRSRFRRSRSDSISSSVCLPSTARSVVCASWLVAARKFSTWITARCGSTTRKYSTALTFSVTLSREITSWLGTSITTMRRSMRTICWMPGIRITRPGPLTRQKRPSWNTTPRSYSRRMRSELATSSSQQDQHDGNADARRDHREAPCVGRGFGGRADFERQAVDAGHAHALAGLQRLARRARCQRSPSTAAQPSPPPNSITSPAAPSRRRRAADHRPPARLGRHADDADDERGRDQRQRADQRQRDAEARRVAVDQQQRAEREGRDAAEPERAVARHEGLGDEEGDAQQDQRQAGVVDRQHLQPPQREQQAHAADHAGRDEARVHELEQQAVDADHHQHQRQARVADHRQQAAAPVGLERHDGGVRGGQRHAAPPGWRRARTTRPSSWRSRSVDVDGDEVDHLARQRVARRQAHRLAHRLLGPGDVAAAQLRQAADVGGGVVDALGGHRVVAGVAAPTRAARRPAVAGCGCRRATAGRWRSASPRRGWSPAPSPRRARRRGCRCRRWRRARPAAPRSRPPASATPGWP